MKLLKQKYYKNYVFLFQLFIIISFLFILSGCKDYTSEKHILNSNPINSINSSFIVKSSDGTIYFQDGRNNNNITQLTDSEENVLKDTYGMCLSIYDKHLYYRDFGNGSNLMRLEIDNPQNRETISDINTYQIIIVDDVIYGNIVDTESINSGLYKISIDGTKRNRIVDAKINCMQYESNYIYYAVEENAQLFKIDLNGNNREEIVLKESNEYVSTTHFIVDSGWIYFNNSNINGYRENFGAIDSKSNICRMRVDGTEFQELANGSVSNIYSNSKEKYLLYISKDNLYSMNLNTLENKQILDKKINWVNVIDNEIYALDWRSENNNSIIYKVDMDTGITTILGE